MNILIYGGQEEEEYKHLDNLQDRKEVSVEEELVGFRTNEPQRHYDQNRKSYHGSDTDTEPSLIQRRPEASKNLYEKMANTNVKVRTGDSCMLR
jgi:hypothetical protein